jgi:hypothetical protein
MRRVHLRTPRLRKDPTTQQNARGDARLDCRKHGVHSWQWPHATGRCSRSAKNRRRALLNTPNACEPARCACRCRWLLPSGGERRPKP